MNDLDLRIERNIKIINNKKKELWEATQHRNFDEVYRTTMELLNWIVNSDDWFLKNDPNYKIFKEKDLEIDGIFLGMRQAYNSFKHNMSIISVEEKKYLDFIVPEYKIEQIAWLSSVELDDVMNSKTAYQAYKDYLEDKSVLETFNKAISFLNGRYLNKNS